MTAVKEAFRPGKAKNSWLTGTATWNWYAITQFILGIKLTIKDYLLILAFPLIGKDLLLIENSEKLNMLLISKIMEL